MEGGKKVPDNETCRLGLGLSNTYLNTFIRILYRKDTCKILLTHPFFSLSTH